MIDIQYTIVENIKLIILCGNDVIQTTATLKR